MYFEIYFEYLKKITLEELTEDADEDELGEEPRKSLDKKTPKVPFF